MTYIDTISWHYSLPPQHLEEMLQHGVIPIRNLLCLETGTRAT